MAAPPDGGVVSARRAGVIAAALVRRCARDPAMVAMFVVVPILGALVFGLADQRANDSLPIGLVRLDSGTLAHALGAQIRVEPELRATEFANRDALLRSLRRGDMYGGVVIPGDYDVQVVAGHRPNIEVIGDESQSTFVAARAGIALVVDRETELLDVARHLAAQSATPLGAALPRAHARLGATSVALERRTANRLTNATGLGRSVAGMLVFFVFAFSMGHSLALFNDRERGVLARAAMTHATPGEIVAGEIAGRFAMAVVQAFVIVAISGVLLGVHWGNVAATVVVIVLFALVAATTSVVIGCRLAGSHEQAIWLTDGFMTVLGVVGGCFFSLRLLPGWVREAGHVSPHAWAVDAFDRLIATNGGMVAILPSLLALGGFAAALLFVAIRGLRRALGD